MKKTTTAQQPRLIRYREVMSQTGLSRSYLYELTKNGEFPASVKLSERSSAWIESEVQQWINGRIEAARANRVEA